MKKLCMVPLLLSQFAVGAPIPPILAIESFESYNGYELSDWKYPLSLPVFIAGGMKMVGVQRGDAYVTYLQSDSLGENQTRGGEQHFRSYGWGLSSSIVIYFPHKVQAFGFGFSGYDGYEPLMPDAPWNTLTAYYQGGNTRFGQWSSGGLSMESLIGFDSVGITLHCVHPELRCETTFGLDDIWYAGDLGPVTTPEPSTWILVALGIGAILVGRIRRQ